MTLRAVSLILIVLSPGCASREAVIPAAVNPTSRHFRADFQRTWQAVLDVLHRNRYEVASAERRSGLISTRWKEVGRSEPRGLFRRTYPLRARLTVWIKPRGGDSFVTVTNEEVIMLSETKSERHPTTTEMEHEILEQAAHTLGVP